MRQFLTGVMLVMATAAGSANAADLGPLYKTAPPAAPVFSWTGCYIGAYGGGAGALNSYSPMAAGGLAGGILGCNYQIDHLVVGLEGEGGWFGVDSQSVFSGGGFTTTTSTNGRWSADLAARVGLAFDRFLVYSKFGAIWIDNQYSTAGSGAGATTTSGEETLPGFLLGVGVEYAITGQWLARAEADFAFMDSTGVNFTCAPAANCFGAVSTTSSQNEFAVIGKIGLSYKF